MDSNGWLQVLNSQIIQMKPLTTAASFFNTVLELIF